jgi:aspartyl protease family protein
MAQKPWRVPDHDPKKHLIWQDVDGKPLKQHYSGHTSPMTRFFAFVIGMALLLFGLSLAFPITGGVDPYLVRAVVIMFIFGGAMAYWSRSSLMRLIKVAGLWAVIIAVISGVYLFRSDFGTRFMTSIDPAGVVSTGDALLVQRGRDGHFWLRASFNGVPIKLMVDTGASNIVLSPEDAKKIGLRSDTLEFSGRADTANGSVPFARATITSVNVGDQAYFDVPVTVNGAEMQGSLLGMTLLNKFASIEFRGDTLILRP